MNRPFLSLIYFSVCLQMPNTKCFAQIITTIAGTGGTFVSAGDGGPATAAFLDNSCGIVFDSKGNLYLMEANANKIRKIDTNGIIHTIAGTGYCGDQGDGGPASASVLCDGVYLAIDNADNLFLNSDLYMRMRKINAAGIISNYAGNGGGSAGYYGDGGPATLAIFNGPQGSAADNSGNLYIVDNGNNIIRKINSGGIITRVAGNLTASYSGDGGPATSAQLNYPSQITVDSAGNFYFTDLANYVIRKVDVYTGIITTFAGSGSVGYSGDGGPASLARFSNSLSGLCFNRKGELFICDAGNYVIRKIDRSGVITTAVGNGTGGYGGDGGPPLQAQLNIPIDVRFDKKGDLYISDGSVIRKVTFSTSTDVMAFGLHSKNLSTYPNPASESIHVNSTKVLDDLAIYNAMGEIVLQKESKNKAEDIDISKLPAGIYFIRTKKSYAKFIKE